MEFKIEIADVCALIKVDDADFAQSLIKDHYNNFLSDKEPSLHVDITVKPVETPSILDSSDEVAIRHNVNKDRIYINGLMGDIEGYLDLLTGKVKGTTIRVAFRFDALIRVIYSLWLVKSSGFLLHAAGVKDNDGAYVFFGVSGSGKTTIARLSEEKTILSDELIAIRSFNGSYQVYGTPFMGEFAGGGINTKADLRHIFLLKKDDKNSLSLINQKQSIKELFQCIVFFGERADLLNILFNLCTDMAEKVPFYKLHFLPDRSFWDCIKEMEV